MREQDCSLNIRAAFSGLRLQPCMSRTFSILTLSVPDPTPHPVSHLLSRGDGVLRGLGKSLWAGSNVRLSVEWRL